MIISIEESSSGEYFNSEEQIKKIADGIYKDYWKNGELFTRVNYINGQLCTKARYLKGKLVGECINWYSTGETIVLVIM
jgi:antitoxin component YwqK of YwqJK toxin-antitoxin module